MKKHIIFFAALAMAGALVLASCGHDETEDSVTVDLPDITVASDEQADETTVSAAETTTKSVTTSAKTTDGKTTTTATAVISGGGIVGGGNQREPSEDATEAPAFENPTEAPIPPTDPPVQNPVQTTPKPVSFSYNSLLSNASDTISALGAPNDTIFAAGCLSNGADQKIYKYNDIEISCYVLGGVEYIYDITITGGNYTTAEGIAVGSSRSAVESVYGAGDAAGNLIFYSSGDKELYIEYSGDTVVSIEYYTPV